MTQHASEPDPLDLASWSSHLTAGGPPSGRVTPMGGGRSGTRDGYYRVREVQSGPPLGPSRSKGSEAACRLSSGSSRRRKCPLPRFVRGGRAAARRRSVPNGDSRRVGVAESSRSTRARRGRVDVSVVMFGDLLGSKRRSKPSKMSDRSASLRACSATAFGRESFPRSAGSPGSAETRTWLFIVSEKVTAS